MVKIIEILNGNYFSLVIIGIFVLGAWHSIRTQKRKAQTYAKETSEDEIRRLAYHSYQESIFSREMKWWHWLLLLSLPTLMFSPLWWNLIIGLYAGEVDLGILLIVAIVIPHWWVYPALFIAAALRNRMNLRLAKRMKTAAANTATAGADTTTPAPASGPPGSSASTQTTFNLNLISEFPASGMEKTNITAEHNAYGKPPKSFLYLYDFRMRRTLRRYNMPHRLAEYGPVFRMQTPNEIGFSKYLELMDGEVFAEQCATNLNWLHRFLESADGGPMPFSRATRPFGRYRNNSFIASDQIWQQAVLLRMDQVDFVVIDARGFTAESPGLTWEIEAAMEHVSTDMLIVLADVTTYMPDLENHLRSGWARRQATDDKVDGAINVVRGGVDPISIKMREDDFDGSSGNVVFRADDLIAVGVLP